MSSLWTPGGERPVNRPETTAPTPPADGPAPGPDPGGDVSPDDLSPEQAEALRAQMQEMQRQMLTAPAEIVVANQIMGIYQLAALHLSQPEPDLDAARIAIDAFVAVVQVLDGRLGEATDTLVQAANDLRAAYVQTAGGPPEPDGQN